MALKGGPRYVKTVASNVEVSQGPHSSDMGGYLEKTVDTTTGAVIAGVTAIGTNGVASQFVQSAESIIVPALTITPATVGSAPFGIAQWSTAFSNVYDPAVFYGWNIGSVLAGGTAGVAGQPSLVMGMESNYIDPASGSHPTMEWYISYSSPDNSTLPQFRVFQATVLRTDNTSHSAHLQLDIGSDSTGFALFMAGATEVARYNTVGFTFALPTTFTGTATFNSTTTVNTTLVALGLQVAATDVLTHGGQVAVSHTTGLGGTGTIQAADSNAFNLLKISPSGGGVALGLPSPATTATSGFPYISANAGAPTGVPVAVTGMNALYYDTTNHKLWVYDTAWKGVVVS